MSNGLTPKQAMPPAETKSTQTGKNNVFVDNQAGGIVNFNYSDAPGTNLNEMLLAIRSFSREYYQLIVTMEDIFDSDNTSNSVIVGSGRALVQASTPPEIYKRCSALSDEGKEELKTFPAIICQESTAFNGNTDPKQMAIYAYITKIKVGGKEIKIYYKPIRIFQQRILCANSFDFGLNMSCTITDLNMSAWTVHKIDLFEAFEDVGLGHLPRPD